MEAIETLLELPAGAGVAALVDLARDHPVDDVRKEALQRLLESDHPSARAVFERALKKQAADHLTRRSIVEAKGSVWVLDGIKR